MARIKHKPSRKGGGTPRQQQQQQQQQQGRPSASSPSSPESDPSSSAASTPARKSQGLPEGTLRGPQAAPPGRRQVGTGHRPRAHPGVKALKEIRKYRVSV